MKISIFLENEIRSINRINILSSNLPSNLKIEYINALEKSVVTESMFQEYLNEISKVDPELLREISETSRTRLKYMGTTAAATAGVTASHLKSNEVSSRLKDVAAKEYGTFEKMDQVRDLDNIGHDIADSVGMGLASGAAAAALLYIYRHYISRQKECNDFRSNEDKFLRCRIQLEKRTIAEIMSKKSVCKGDKKCISKLEQKASKYSNNAKKFEDKLKYITKYDK